LFSHELLYPERVKGDWYVSAEYVKLFSNDGDHNLEKGEVATTTKHIVVDVSEQKLYAYQGDLLFMEVSVSTGLLLTPTDRGIFTIFKMTPSRFMQGPIPGVSNQVYDLPGVPWNLYFTAGGAVIHGAYWHNNFGRPWSHGCVNLTTEDAKKLYNWAEVGTKVKVQN
jgi:lipoprotein-anchoring transpeptidase ErfK/SrfK